MAVIVPVGPSGCSSGGGGGSDYESPVVALCSDDCSQRATVFYQTVDGGLPVVAGYSVDGGPVVAGPVPAGFGGCAACDNPCGPVTTRVETRCVGGVVETRTVGYDCVSDMVTVSSWVATVEPCDSCCSQPVGPTIPVVGVA